MFAIHRMFAIYGRSMLTVALGGAVLIGCSGTAVTESIQPVVELTIQGAAQSGQSPNPSVTTSSVALVVLEGVIAAPNPCYTFEATIAADDHALTVTVAAHQQPGMCIQVLGSFRYQARITGLPAGTYPVTMIYTYPDTGWEPQSFNLSLTVPE